MPDQRELAAILLKHGYTGTKKIGEGSFGVALLVEDTDGHKGVCKVVDVSKASSKETQEARREGRLLSQVKHPYIVRYRENFAERGWLCIVMDYCDGGDLTAQIDAARKRRERLPEPSVLRWFTQSTLALKYLHGKHVLHRDLKPSNIFLTQGGDIRLGDFGISKVMSCTSAFAKTFVGTPYYLAPEVITEKPYSWPADIWAMGCILYQLCAQRVPFDAANITSLAQKICKTPAPQVPMEFSQNVRDTALEMMQRNPGARPKAETIINKGFIQDVVRAMLSEATKTPEKPKAKYEVMDQFQRFDQNGDGVIDKQELARVLKHLDANVWSDQSIGQIMTVADTNKDGKIQFDEFLEWIFGKSDGRSGVMSKLEHHMTAASVACDLEDPDDLLEQLQGWRQYVDMGCLRVLPPECCTKTCEALVRLILNSSKLLESSALRPAYGCCRQIRAILQAVEQLLDESSRQHIQRIGVSTSRTAIKGFTVERSDGLRYSTGPLPTQWEPLGVGERVVEVSGTAAAVTAASSRRGSPAPDGRRTSSPAPDDPIVGTLTLVTNLGRKLDFQSALGAQGTPFQFKAPEGEEIEQLSFSNRTCTGVKTVPVVVSWTTQQVTTVRRDFQKIAKCFWPLLLKLAFKMGPKYGNYALLEGRRLGLDVTAPAAAVSTAVGKVPSCWDVSAMGGLGPSGIPTISVAGVTLSEADARHMQELLNMTFERFSLPPDEVGKAKVPIALQLVKASRLQNWNCWGGYSARIAEIREELATMSRDGCSFQFLSDPKTSNHMEALSSSLDDESNSRWLFHAISMEGSKAVLREDFDIDTAGAEDGMLYGRGIYLTEWCSEVDRMTCEDEEGLRCMLLCRTTLGRVWRDEALLPDKVNLIHQCTGGEYHGVLGDRQEKSPGCARDFVVYDRNQVYPEFVLWYRRVYD